MVEAAPGSHGLCQRALASVAKGRVAEVVRQSQRLGQVLVEDEHAGNRPGDLCHLQAVGEARAVVVALVEHEHLRLVGEAAERGGVHDAIAVALVGGAHGAAGLGIYPASAGVRLGCIGRHRPGGAGFAGQLVLSRAISHVRSPV